MKRLSLNRNQIKYIIIAAMLIDHIAWAFVPMNTVLGQVMHFIGRLTGPTMAYFLAEGYVHTRNVKKYAQRLGIFALISWLPYCLFEYEAIPITIQTGKIEEGLAAFRFYLESSDVTLIIYPWFGVIYTLFLSLLAIWLWDKGKLPKFIKVLVIIFICMISIFGDWPIFDILYTLTLFCYRENTKKKWIIFSIITLFTFIFGGIHWDELYQFGIFLVPLMILTLYNGESGSKKPVHKWFFYIFYPLHLVILGIIELMI